MRWPVGARLVVYAGRPSAVRDAFGRVRRALDAARRTAETNAYRYTRIPIRGG